MTTAIHHPSSGNARASRRAAFQVYTGIVVILALIALAVVLVTRAADQSGSAPAGTGARPTTSAHVADCRPTRTMHFC